MTAIPEFFRFSRALLRGDHLAAAPGDPARPDRSPGMLVGVVIVFGFLYGGVMGTYDGRALQMLYSAIKVPLLLLVTFGLSLPSFFIFNTLLGLRDDFARVFRALLATQGGLTIILASLAPITEFSYLSGLSYRVAILFNGLMFGIASVSAQWILRREYRPLIAANPRHRTMLKVWIFIFTFVGIQMGWVLRPFIGDPANKVQFFRPDSLGNAYVVVLEMIWNVLTIR
ncbi:MAG: hypothetical protein ABS79_06520 [Planctomycetes bacterium SCN 63-9]|nr:MAG: hypothetical protein ABS79_06520 [Planctomycetes bacterium SCN 63-9]